MAPRERNLAIITALMASGQTAFLLFYLNRAVQKSITQTQMSEIPTHLAFYAGWSLAISAAGVIQSFSEGRSA